MEDLLDDNERKITDRKPVFTRLAFGTSILTITLCVILFSSYPSTVTKIWRIPTVLFTRATILSAITGFGFSVTGLIRKEKLKYLKLIGTIVNFIFFAFFMAAIVSVLMDLKK